MSFTKRYAHDVADLMGCPETPFSDECYQFGECLIGLAKNPSVGWYCGHVPSRLSSIADDIMKCRSALEGVSYCYNMQLCYDEFKKLLANNTVAELLEFYEAARLTAAHMSEVAELLKKEMV